MAKHDPKDKKKQQRAGQPANLVDGDWGSLFAQLSSVIDWALDIAAKLARDDDQDLDAIENVRAFVHGWLDGSRAEVPLTDLLTTIAILFAAIEIDLGIESVELLAPLRTMLDTPSVLPAVLRCPGAYRDGNSTVRIRRFPGRRRNADSAFSNLAA